MTDSKHLVNDVLFVVSRQKKEVLTGTSKLKYVYYVSKTTIRTLFSTSKIFFELLNYWLKFQSNSFILFKSIFQFILTTLDLKILNHRLVLASLRQKSHQPDDEKLFA